LNVGRITLVLSGMLVPLVSGCAGDASESEVPTLTT
jgi:hypothetical protein